RGVSFASSSDTEIIGQLLIRTPGETLDAVLASALPRVEGAYCLILLSRDELVAARDPLGIRPMCLGRLHDAAAATGGDGSVIASETCALDVVGAEFVREIEPGEIVSVSADGVRSTRLDSSRLGRTAGQRAM